MKHYALAGGKICGRHRQRDAQFFKCLNLQDAIQEADHALVAGESVARQGPAGEVFEAHPGGDLLQFRYGNPAAVSRANERAHTSAGDKTDGNVFFFENFEYANMGEAAGKAAAQGQTDAGVSSGWFGGRKP